MTFVVLVSVVVLFSMYLGGIIGRVFYFNFSNHLDRLLVFTGGLLIGLIIFEILPHSMEEYPLFGITLGILLSVIFMIVVDSFFHKNDADINGEKMPEEFLPFLLLVFAIAIHNIPTGIALGSSYISNVLNISSLIVATILHHIPEGLTLMVTSLLARYQLKTFIIATSLLSVLLSISIFAGLFFANSSLRLNGIMMGSAIGTLSFVSLFEMVWKGRKKISNLELGIYSLFGVGAMWSYFTLV